MSNKLSTVIKAGLESFLATKAEYDRKAETGPFGYHEDFALLRQKTLKYREEKIYPAAEGEKPHNYRKNRYKDILPYDYTRVELGKINDMSGTDYINANYIKGANDRVMYIAAQGPLPNTVKDFWRMLFECNTKVVLMACSEYEGDPPKHKCERYWPETMDEELKFDKITVTLEKEVDTSFKDYKIRHIRAECNQEVHKLFQMHYIGWPDHGVPDNVTPLIDMITQSRLYQAEDSPAITIHCSAGCGRTGTIIAVDIAWNLLKIGKLTTSFSLFEVIDEMRKQRPSLVQSLEQYRFVFEVVTELFERHLDIMNKHAYENVVMQNVLFPPKDSKEEVCYSNSSTDSAFDSMGDTETNPNDNKLSQLTNKAIRQTVSKLKRTTLKPEANNVNVVKPQVSRTSSNGSSKPSAPPKPPRFQTSVSDLPKESEAQQTKVDISVECQPTVSLRDVRAKFEKSSTESLMDQNHSRASSQSSRSSVDSLPRRTQRPVASPRTSIGTPQFDKASKTANGPSPAEHKTAPPVFDTYSLAGESNEATMDIADVCEEESSDELEKETGQTSDAPEGGEQGDAYAYADPFQKDKWSLQHVALGISAVGDEGAYSEVALPSPSEREESAQPGGPNLPARARSKQQRGPAYEEIPDPQRPMIQPPTVPAGTPMMRPPLVPGGMPMVLPIIKKQSQEIEYNPYSLPDEEVDFEDSFTDDEEEEPPDVPVKRIEPVDTEPSKPTASPKPSKSAAILTRFGIGIKPKPLEPMDAPSIMPKEVFFEGKNLGFPNRLKSPVGPRPMKK